MSREDGQSERIQMDSDKLRAIVLSALMVLSVFCGTVAFSGSAI